MNAPTKAEHDKRTMELAEELASAAVDNAHEMSDDNDFALLLAARAALKAHIEAQPATPQPAQEPAPAINVKALRHAVRTAWLTGVADFRRLYDKELFAVLGIVHFQDLYPESARASREALAPQPAQEPGTANGPIPDAMLQAAFSAKAQPAQREPAHWEKLRALGWQLFDCRVCGESAGAMVSPQPTQEPVAWIREWDGDDSDIGTYLSEVCTTMPADGYQWQPLYTSPQPAPAARPIPEGWNIERKHVPPFRNIHVKAPNGYVAVVQAPPLSRNPENILYMLADALLFKQGQKP